MGLLLDNACKNQKQFLWARMCLRRALQTATLSLAEPALRNQLVPGLLIAKLLAKTMNAISVTTSILLKLLSLTWLIARPVPRADVMSATAWPTVDGM